EGAQDRRPEQHAGYDLSGNGRLTHALHQLAAEAAAAEQHHQLGDEYCDRRSMRHTPRSMRVTVAANLASSVSAGSGVATDVAKCRMGVSGCCQTDGSPTRQVLQWRAYSCCAGCALGLLLGSGAEIRETNRSSPWHAGTVARAATRFDGRCVR